MRLRVRSGLLGFRAAWCYPPPAGRGDDLGPGYLLVFNSLRLRPRVPLHAVRAQFDTIKRLRLPLTNSGRPAMPPQAIIRVKRSTRQSCEVVPESWTGS